MRRTVIGMMAIAATTSLVACVPEAPAVPPVAGGTGGGDSYFPAMGNTGYDVAHYDLDLDYDPTTKALAATAVIKAATVGAPLSSFSLDLRDLTASSVTVGGRPAAFTQGGGELIITPESPVSGTFVTTVVYGGTIAPGCHRGRRRYGCGCRGRDGGRGPGRRGKASRDPGPDERHRQTAFRQHRWRGGTAGQGNHRDRSQR